MEGAQELLGLTPCDMWPYFRGRTTWLVGDSMMQVLCTQSLYVEVFTRGLLFSFARRCRSGALQLMLRCMPTRLPKFEAWLLPCI